MVKNIDKAKFKPIRMGWSYDYGLNSEVGMLNAFEYLRSLMTFSDIQELMPMDIFVSGPHSRDGLNLTDRFSFGHYNPLFVEYFKSIVDSLIGDRNFISSTRGMMIKYGLIGRLNRMQKIYKFIMNNQAEFEKFKFNYQKMLNNRTWPKETYSGYRSYLPKKLNNSKYWNWSETDYYFWIRRSIDGTMPQWIEIIDSILKSYSDSNRND